MPVTTLALDLERTLVDNALSGQPRPGLYEFLEFCCERFSRLVLFTTVEGSDAREVLEFLEGEGAVPSQFLDRLEYIDWSGEYKDLHFIPDCNLEEVLLVDDDEGWIRPDQKERWLFIQGWEGGPDTELARVQALLST